MKDNLRRMNWLIKIFGLESFYRIEFDKEYVTAYVPYGSEEFDIEKANNLFLTVKDEWGTRKLVRDNYKIILS